MRILRSRLLAPAEDEAAARRRRRARSQVRTVDRSERVRTYNFPENRIADHRVGYKAYNLDAGARRRPRRRAGRAGRRRRRPRRARLAQAPAPTLWPVRSGLGCATADAVAWCAGSRCGWRAGRACRQSPAGRRRAARRPRARRPARAAADRAAGRRRQRRAASTPWWRAGRTAIRCSTCSARAVLGPVERRGRAGVFIPRPETECCWSGRWTRSPTATSPLVVDLCTGSGALALAIAAWPPGRGCTRSRRDPAALAWARRNARRARGGGGTPVKLRGGDVAGPTCWPTWTAPSTW